MRDPVTTIESSEAGVGAATLSSSCAASSVCAKAGVAIMTAINDRLAKPKFGRKRDATSFILRIWIIPGFLLKADIAQLALPNRKVVRRHGVVGPAMERSEERSGGKEGVSPVRTGCSAYH